MLTKYVSIPDLLPEGRALVPGFGRGYDLTTLASATRQVLGIEIAPTAIDAAQTRLNSLPYYPHKQQITFKCCSFFHLDEASDKFDLVYDQTFLCALPPQMRDMWADKMAEIIKPGGMLLTLIFPIGNTKKTGPPYPQSLSEMEELIIPRGFACEELRMLERDEYHPSQDESVYAGAGCGVGRWRKL